MKYSILLSAIVVIGCIELISAFHQPTKQDEETFKHDVDEIQEAVKNKDEKKAKKGFEHLMTHMDGYAKGDKEMKGGGKFAGLMNMAKGFMGGKGGAGGMDMKGLLGGLMGGKGGGGKGGGGGGFDIMGLAKTFFGGEGMGEGMGKIGEKLGPLISMASGLFGKKS